VGFVLASFLLTSAFVIALVLAIAL